MIYRILISSLFLCLAVFWVIFVYRFHYYPDYGNGFLVGDWLINYEDGGFKRRGLFGSLAFIFQDITGLKLNLIIISLQLVIFFSFLIVTLILIWNKKINLWYVCLFLSPLTFLAYFNDLGYLARKESILFLVFAIFIYRLDRNRLHWFAEICILFFISVATLFHELIIFYIPYFLLAMYIHNSNTKLWKYALYFLAAFFPVLAIVLYGGEIDQGRSLDLISARGVVLAKHNIFIDSVLLNVRSFLREHAFNYFLYAISFIIGVIHFGLYLRNKLRPGQAKIVYGLFGAFLYSLPLFYLATDWGRWLHIHFVLVLLMITLLLKNRDNQEQGVTSLRSVFLTEYKAILIIPFLLLWGVKHCHVGFVPGGAIVSLYKLLFSI